MRHDRDAIAAFQGGDARFVYARDAETGELFYLEDGDGARLKKFTRRQLRCIVPDCPAPELTCVSRTGKRDGFSHLPGGGSHDPGEGFHLQAQLRIAEWARLRYPECTVRLEEASNADRERIADVMVTHPSGARIAFEVQYASMTPAEFLERHQSFRRQEIVDVWVFGHIGVHFKPHDDQMGLSPTLEAVAAAGLPIMWVNPIEGLIGLATTTILGGERTFEVPASRYQARLRTEPLDVFHLSSDGVTSPGLSFLRKNIGLAAEEAARASAQEAAALETAAARAIAKARAVASAAKRAAEKKDRQQVAATAALSAAETVWGASKLHARTLEVFAGEWPAFLDMSPRAGRSAVPQQQWQAALYLDFIHDAGADVRINTLDLSAALSRAGFASVGDASVREWLGLLRLRGTLREYMVSPRTKRRAATFVYLTTARSVPAAADADACTTCRAGLPEVLRPVGAHVTCNPAEWLMAPNELTRICGARRHEPVG